MQVSVFMRIYTYKNSYTPEVVCTSHAQTSPSGKAYAYMHISSEITGIYIMYIHAVILGRKMDIYVCIPTLI